MSKKKSSLGQFKNFTTREQGNRTLVRVVYQVNTRITIDHFLKINLPFFRISLVVPPTQETCQQGYPKSSFPQNTKVMLNWRIKQRKVGSLTDKNYRRNIHFTVYTNRMMSIIKKITKIHLLDPLFSSEISYRMVIDTLSCNYVLHRQ